MGTIKTSTDGELGLWEVPESAKTNRGGYRREVRRLDLLRMTAKVLVERGYHGASLDDIAQRLNLGKSALYHYYQGKDELVLSCLVTCHEHVIDSLTPVANKEGLNAKERLRRMVVAQLEMIWLDYPELSHLFIHPMDWPEPIALAVRRWRKQHDYVFRSVIEEGIGDGCLRPRDALVSRMCLHGALNSAPTWLGPTRGRDSIELIASTIMDMFVFDDDR